MTPFENHNTIRLDLATYINFILKGKMKTPEKWEEIPVGQIFQISPAENDPISLEFGGDFLIGTQYFESGVIGYLACVYIKENITRYNKIAFLQAEWNLLEFVGSAFWFRNTDKEFTSFSKILEFQQE